MPNSATAGPSLLDQFLVSKFDDHLPLYRQSEIYARMWADPRCWTGEDAMKVLAAIIEQIEAEVMAEPVLQRTAHRSAS